MKLLVKHDGSGGRLLALAPPPGQEPLPFLRLPALGAYLLSIELTFPPLTRKWVEVPCEAFGKEEV